MSMPDRIAHVRKQIELLHEQQAQLEKDALLTSDSLIKIRIQQQIREQIRPKIQQYETEKCQLQNNNHFSVQSQSNFMIANRPIHVYLSCSSDRDDTKLRDKLEKCLSIFETEGEIKIWHRGKVKPGMTTMNEVKSWIKLSTVFLILTSHDYISSQIHDNSEEYNLIISEQKENIKTIIPVILSHCSWDKTDLKEFQCLPKNKRPISGCREWTQKKALNTVIEEFQEIFNL
jgi:hypothetical protein